MDFGLTDDQREIQRTARELLGDARETGAGPRARRVGANGCRALAGAVRAGLARHRDLRGARRRRARPDRALDPLRGARPLARARAVPGKRDGGDGDRARRHARAARALAAGPGLGRDDRRARRGDRRCGRARDRWRRRAADRARRRRRLGPRAERRGGRGRRRSRRSTRPARRRASNSIEAAPATVAAMAAARPSPRAAPAWDARSWPSAPSSSGSASGRSR